MAVLIGTPKAVVSYAGYDVENGVLTVTVEDDWKTVGPVTPPKTLVQLFPPSVDFQAPSPLTSPPT